MRNGAGEPLPEARSPRDLWGQAQGSLEESGPVVSGTHTAVQRRGGRQPRAKQRGNLWGGGRGAGEEKKGCLGVLLALSEGLPCSSASVCVHRTRRLAVPKAEALTGLGRLSPSAHGLWLSPAWFPTATHPRLVLRTAPRLGLGVGGWEAPPGGGAKPGAMCRVWCETLTSVGGSCFSCEGGALGSGLQGPRRCPSSVPYPPRHRPCASSPCPGTSAHGLPRALFALGFLARRVLGGWRK